MKKNNHTQSVLVDQLINPKNQNTHFLKKIFLYEWKKLLWLVLSSLMFTFGIQIFLIEAKTFTSGLSSIPQLIALLFDQFRPYIFLTYFLLNVPLLVYFWKKMKKSFLILTLIWMIFNTIWGFVMEIQQINIFLKEITYVGDVKDVWAIYIYGILAAITVGTGLAIAFKQGASTGGTDIIVYYFSKKYKRNLGGILNIIALMIASLSIIIFSLVTDFRNQNNNSFSNIFGPRTQTTILYIVISSFLVTVIFPKYRKVKIVIHSEHIELIIQRLKNAKYAHAFTLIKAISGYTGKDIFRIETYALLLEAKTITNFVKKIDPKVWISIDSVRKIQGYINTASVD